MAEAVGNKGLVLSLLGRSGAAIGDGDDKAIIKAVYNIAGDPSEAETNKALVELQTSGMLKTLKDERMKQSAIAKPKEYLEKYNEALNTALAESAKAAVDFRKTVLASGVASAKAEQYAKEYFEAIAATRKLQLSIEFPSDVYNEVEKLMKEHRTIAG